MSDARPHPIVLDLLGGRITLDADEVTRLRDVAAAKAGQSSAARDLSLLLDRALQHRKPVALRRAEVQTLIRLAADARLDQLAAQLAAANGKAVASP